jgi:hypothetical protein
MLQLYAGIRRHELPVKFRLAVVSIIFPGGDRRLQLRQVGNTPIDALSTEDAEFNFGHVKPTVIFGRVIIHQQDSNSAS